MRRYPDNAVPDFLKVSSIVSVFTSPGRSYDNENGEAHRFWEFLYVINGDMNILVDGEVFSLHGGSLIFYPPHSFHSVAASNNAEICVVGFETDSPAMYDFTSNVLMPGEEQKKSIASLAALGQTLFETAPRDKYLGGVLLRRDAHQFELQRFAALLELFLIELYRENSRCGQRADESFSNIRHYRDEQFAALTSYLRENIGKSPSLADISAACGISIPSLHRLCKRHCGCGPITLFISFKISEAKRYITGSSLNFTQISEKLGFSSVHYFSKLFKEKTGMTPSQFARAAEAKRRAP